MRITLILLTLALHGFAMQIGNLASPALETKSILWDHVSWCSIRLGFIDDWIFEQTYKDEFVFDDTQIVNHTHMQLSTYAGSVTVNFQDRFDIYTILGSSRMQIDEEIFTKGAFCWAVGSKLILYKTDSFFLGTDFKYFFTSQKPRYFLVEDLPYNLMSDFRLELEQIQGALGLSYKYGIFTPYINASFISSHIQNRPGIALVRLPDENEMVDVNTKSILSKNPWGLALGFTLTDSEKMSLSFEYRALNENALNVSGEIRF
jgi:hypothetical protein